MGRYAVEFSKEDVIKFLDSEGYSLVDLIYDNLLGGRSYDFLLSLGDDDTKELVLEKIVKQYKNPADFRQVMRLLTRHGNYPTSLVSQAENMFYRIHGRGAI